MVLRTKANWGTPCPPPSASPQLVRGRLAVAESRETPGELVKTPVPASASAESGLTNTPSDDDIDRETVR